MAKTVVITGASRGIGLATAKQFLAQGWHVVGTYNANPIPLESPNLAAVKLDLASDESIQEAAETVRRAAPKIDALINNAAVELDGRVEIIDPQKVAATFNIDVIAVIKFTDALLPHLAEGAHIVNLDSDYGALSEPQDNLSSAGYRIAKAALNMYTRVLAFHLEPRKITVSSLDPGWVKTDMGMGGATDTEQPDREPAQPAAEIYELVTTVTETGQFWRFGRKRSW